MEPLKRIKILNREVRLNEEGVKWKIACNGFRNPLKWQQRIGVVKSVSHDRLYLSIVWNSTRHKDGPIPVKFVEFV